MPRQTRAQTKKSGHDILPDNEVAALTQLLETEGRRLGIPRKELYDKFNEFLAEQGGIVNKEVRTQTEDWLERQRDKGKGIEVTSSVQEEWPAQSSLHSTPMASQSRRGAFRDLQNTLAKVNNGGSSSNISGGENLNPDSTTPPDTRESNPRTPTGSPLGISPRRGRQRLSSESPLARLPRRSPTRSPSLPNPPGRRRNPFGTAMSPTLSQRGYFFDEDDSGFQDATTILGSSQRLEKAEDATASAAVQQLTQSTAPSRKSSKSETSGEDEDIMQSAAVLELIRLEETLRVWAGVLDKFRKAKVPVLPPPCSEKQLRQLIYGLKQHEKKLESPLPTEYKQLMEDVNKLANWLAYQESKGDITSVTAYAEFVLKGIRGNQPSKEIQATGNEPTDDESTESKSTETGTGDESTQPKPTETGAGNGPAGEKSTQTEISFKPTETGMGKPDQINIGGDDRQLDTEEMLKKFPLEIKKHEVTTETPEKFHLKDPVANKYVDAIIHYITPRGALFVSVPSRNKNHPTVRAAAIIPASKARLAKKNFLASGGKTGVPRDIASFENFYLEDFRPLLVGSTPEKNSARYPETAIVGKFTHEKNHSIFNRSGLTVAFGVEEVEEVLAKLRITNGTPHPQKAIDEGWLDDIIEKTA